MDDVEVDRFLADLRRWAADRRVEEAADARQEEAWLRRRAEEEARFTGLLVDLAEAAAPVTVGTVARRSHHGHVVAVAQDFLVLHSGSGRPVLLPYRGVTVVRAGVPIGTGSARLPPLGARLAHALAGLVGERPRVGLATMGGDTLSGELHSVGVDVVTLRLEGGTATVHLPVEALAEVTLFG